MEKPDLRPKLSRTNLAKIGSIFMEEIALALRAVFFNRGSAEPQGSASICQGFRSWPVINKLACEILPNNIVEILVMKYFVRN